MSQELQSLLRQHGPLLSSALVDILQRQGLSREAARQRVSRARPPVQKLSSLTFPNRESFIYLKSDFQTWRYFVELEKSLKSTNSKLANVIDSFRARGGIVSVEHSQVFSGLPIRPVKGHRLHDTAIKSLVDVALLRQVEILGVPALELWDVQQEHSVGLGSSVVEEILRELLASWLVKVGWTSSGAVKIWKEGEEPPLVGPFAWDVTGPCYLKSVTRSRDRGVKQGFISCDVANDKTMDLASLRYFLSKSQVIDNMKMSSNIQPLYLANYFENDALMHLRKLGIIALTTETLFGEEVVALLRSLSALIDGISKKRNHEYPEQLIALRRLTKLEGASLNLRGIFLELVVAYILQQDGYTVEIRKKIIDRETNERFEIDVLATKLDSVVCVECKGLAPDTKYGVAELESWIKTTLPKVCRWLRKEHSGKNLITKFVVSTDYSDDAHLFISQENARDRRIPNEFEIGRDVLASIQKLNQSALADAFREQFYS